MWEATHQPTTQRLPTCFTQNHLRFENWTLVNFFPLAANIGLSRKQSGLTRLFGGLTQMPGWPQRLKFPHILTLLWFSSRYTSKCRPQEIVWCEGGGEWCFVLGTVSICGAYSLVCQHEAARGKAFLFAKSMHWISGPSPSPQVTQRDGALIKRLLFRAVHVHVLI